MADLDADLEQVKTEFSEAAQKALDQAATFARERPHLAVGIALGLGWVLGNGLHPRLVTSAARLGYKALVGGAVASSGLMGILSGGAERDGDATASRRHAPAGARRATPEEGVRPRNGAVVKE